MKVQKKIKVDLSGSELQCPVKVVAGDTAIQLVLEYIGFDIPSGTTATLYVRKPSKKFVYQTDNITISGNVVTIDVNKQAIIESGHAFFNVTLKNGTDEISTFSNYFDIDRNYKDSTAEESHTVITGFEEMIEEFRAIVDEKIADEQIAATVETYLLENPVDLGDVTKQDIIEAVYLYLDENPIDTSVAKFDVTDDGAGNVTITTK